MDTKKFLEDFEKGELGDSIDLVEWSSLYKIYQRITERMHILEGRRNQKIVGD
jgi:hypothetical protein